MIVVLSQKISMRCLINTFFHITINLQNILISKINKELDYKHHGVTNTLHKGLIVCELIAPRGVIINDTYTLESTDHCLGNNRATSQLLDTDGFRFVWSSADVIYSDDLMNLVREVILGKGYYLVVYFRCQKFFLYLLY